MRYLLLCCLLLASTLLADSAAPGPNPPYAVQWKKIDVLLAKEQTATAAPLVEKIYQQARREGNAPAYVRALLYKIRLLSAKDNDADEKAIALLEGDVQAATFPARPILHSLLAGLYTSYFNRHRYQLYQRTQGAAPTTDAATPGQADGGTSLATWDARRLGRTIARHYRLSVQDEPQRQLQTTLAALDSLVAGGDAEGRAQRPSLYDLLAQRAIAGLQNQELTVTEPEKQFTLADYPAAQLFGPAAEFAQLPLQAPADDSLNHQLLTLQLLQQLTRQRLTQPQYPAALAAVDLQRLKYLHELAQDTAQAAAYEPALARMAATYQALPISTEFGAAQAEARHAAGDDIAAVRLAHTAEARFPQARGARKARLLREQIERPELSFEAADIVAPGQPWRLDLTARNVSALHAWAYRISLREWEDAQNYQTHNQLVAERYGKALKKEPAAQWTIPVPVHPLDYKEQKLAAAGAALPVGYYLVVVANAPRPVLEATPGVATCYALLGASELSITHRRLPGTGAPELLVLQRQSGQPLAGVSAQATYWHKTSPTQQLKRQSAVVQSNDKGLIDLPAPLGNDEAERPEARVWRGPDTLVTSNLGYYNRYSSESDEPETTCFLFTDRAIYRPGQTVYFKGIVVQRQGGRSRLLTGQKQEVTLEDANADDVQSLSFTTSDFGSFHGSFVLPAGRLNGEWKLSTDDGELTFAVEDYKRPTFYVQLDSVPGRPQLGQPLAVSGRGRAYAGPATDGAQVQYRVTRRELWPLFGYGFRRGGRIGYPGRGGTTEIAHGSTTTDADGRFQITFTPPATPRPAEGRYQPGYLFEVTADVTTPAGETRSASRGYALGHNPLSLRLAGPELADKRRLPAIRLFGSNATGEALPAAGTLRLLTRRYRPNPPGVPGPAPENDAHELPAELVKALPFDTKAGAALDVAALLADVSPGRYRLEALAAGPDSARAQLDFTLYDSQARTVPYATPDWFVALADSVAPGQPAAILLGSATTAHVLLEAERGGQLLRQEWLTLAPGEQRRVEVASSLAPAAGPLYVHTTQVQAGRLYQHTATVQVAERPQPLQLSLSTFRDRLQPGQHETWRLIIRRPDGSPADAELLATLYDQSLDLFRQHSFQGLSKSDDYSIAQFSWSGEFGTLNSRTIQYRDLDAPSLPVQYPLLNTQYAGGTLQGEFVRAGGLPTLARSGNFGNQLQGRVAGVQIQSLSPGSAPQIRLRGTAAASPKQLSEVVVVGYGTERRADLTGSVSTVSASFRSVDLSAIKTRSDFRETALWEPALRTDAQGNVVLEFQMPEAVTRWQLLTLAHDQQLRSGQLARQLVTQKEIQLTPNAPRFLRPGDSFAFAATLANLTDSPVAGTAQLTLLDAATGQDITAQLLPGPAQQPARAGAHQSQALSWPLTVPADFAPVAVTYKVVAQASAQSGKKKSRPTFSDGEQNTLPVLPNRVLVTESLPLSVVGPGTRAFELTKLSSTSSATRRNQSLTLELTASPAWYAVQSLPYLMEYPYECSEQVFDRLYANLLAASILKQNPRIRPILAEWQRQAQSGTAQQREALAGRLAQNQDLKNLLLQETPWVQDARSETERLARLSALFDSTRLATETARSLHKLRAMQLPNGSFPWFERMPADRYLTQVVVAGLGKLRTLGAFDASDDDTASELLTAALGYLDGQLTRDYAELQKLKGVQLTADHLTDEQIQALYARSFWPQQPVTASARPALAYYQQQAALYWPGRTRYLQAQLALALHRADARSAASAAIMQALRENALHSPDLGMYWADVHPGYYWRDAPTETQATLIEAFWETGQDAKVADEMKLWLLRQKQTQHWPSTRATADACYALLLRGTDWLATPAQPLQVSLGGQPLALPPGQAGTGYLARTWPGAEVQPAQGRVIVTKPATGVAWGALYWQYFENLDKVTAASAGLSLERQLYREAATAAGPTLETLTAANPLHVGDVLVVRLVLRTDRALEYVHLKDQRAAGLEPISQLSGYQYQQELGYYLSPRDAATHFFFGAVPRGTHVLEYRLRASQRGEFSGGLSQVQCLYAPEFGATSAGQRLVIR